MKRIIFLIVMVFTIIMISSCNNNNEELRNDIYKVDNQVDKENIAEKVSIVDMEEISIWSNY